MKRQGDLLIIAVEDIPAKAKKLDHLILAEGEKTGHLHQLDHGAVYEKDEYLYFQVPSLSEVTLTHPEHGAVVFTPGRYKVIRQREYAPEGWRYVQD